MPRRSGHLLLLRSSRRAFSVTSATVTSPWAMACIAILIACSVGCARSAKPQDPDAGESRGTPESLALSHLKAADVALERHSMESAREAVGLSTEALNWAPPKSRVRRWLVARMLLTRARAQTELGQLYSAVTDLEAAVVWAKQDKATPEILFAEIHLAQATALLRLKKPEEAQAQVDAARLRAQALGADGAALLCDALLLEGDIAVRLGDPERPSPEHYFRQVFDVAARFDYPEDTWVHLDRSLARLAITDEATRAALMGPVQARKADLAAAKLERPQRISSPGRQEGPGLTSVSSGSVPGAAETISELHQGGFRHCYRQALIENPEASGSIRLTISIGSEGQVESVSETHYGLDAHVVDCVLEVARGAHFERPESTKAVVVVPVSFVRQ